MSLFSFGNGSDAPYSEEELERLRLRMVERQIKDRGIKDPLVLEAMQSIKRHEFVLPGQERAAYEDGPLPINAGQTISQPYVVALMTELARIDSNSIVLEIGTGSGYQTAVLARIAKDVYSIEIREELAAASRQRLEKLGFQNVHFRTGDGYQGWPEAAPFDAVLLTAAPDHIPQPLVDQLRISGRMVIPIGDYYQELEVVIKTDQGVVRERTIPVRFVPMTGEARKRE